MAATSLKTLKSRREASCFCVFKHIPLSCASRRQAYIPSSGKFVLIYRMSLQWHSSFRECRSYSHPVSTALDGRPLIVAVRFVVIHPSFFIAIIQLLSIYIFSGGISVRSSGELAFFFLRSRVVWFTHNQSMNAPMYSPYGACDTAERQRETRANISKCIPACGGFLSAHTKCSSVRIPRDDEVARCRVFMPPHLPPQ